MHTTTALDLGRPSAEPCSPLHSQAFCPGLWGYRVAHVSLVSRAPSLTERHRAEPVSWAAGAGGRPGHPTADKAEGPPRVSSPHRQEAHVTRRPGLPCTGPHPLPGTARAPVHQGLTSPQPLPRPPQRLPSSRQTPSRQRSAYRACPTHGTSPSSFPHPGVHSGGLGVPPKP